MGISKTPTLGTWGIGALALALEGDQHYLGDGAFKNVVLLVGQVALDVLGYIPAFGQFSGLLRIGVAVTLAFSAVEFSRYNKQAMLYFAVAQATRGIIEVSGLTQINLFLDIVGISANVTYLLI